MAKGLSQIEKVAVLLMSLGEDLASELIQKLPQADAQKILKTLSKLGRVDQQTALEIQNEFQELLTSPTNSLPDGASSARRIISKAFDAETSRKLSEGLPRKTPQSFLDAEHVDAKILWQLLSKEHHQTIALILAHLSPKKAGDIVSFMHPSIRGDVLVRLATLKEIDPSVIDDIDEVLSKALEQAKHRNTHQLGGARKTAEIISLFASDQRRDILAQLENKSPEIASEVKAGMFTFEDLQKLDRADIEKLLRKVQQQDLEIALRKCPVPVSEIFYAAMSERRAEQIRDNIAAGKPVPIAKIAEAQMKIAAIASELIANGEIRDPMDEAV